MSKCEENVLKVFYETRAEKLSAVKLQDILNQKNPYLFRAKNAQTAEQVVKEALEACLLPQEEMLFADLMKDLAIHICGMAYHGKRAKPGLMKSVDLEFEKNDNYYIMAIKPDPDWGTRDQVDGMKMDFKHARFILARQGITKNIIAVNGCLYGKETRPLKTDKDDPEQTYQKYCGEEFWAFISGDNDLYVKLMGLLGKEAQKREALFRKIYIQKNNQMIYEFGQNFIKKGLIDWEKLITVVSKKKPEQNLFYS